MNDVLSIRVIVSPQCVISIWECNTRLLTAMKLT
jgi:hypothetical protein